MESDNKSLSGEWRASQCRQKHLTQISASEVTSFGRGAVSTYDCCSRLENKYKSQSSDHALLFSSTNVPLFGQHILLKWITWSMYFVLLKGEKKEDGCDFLRGSRKGLTTHLSFWRKLQSKSTHVPLGMRPSSLHLHRYFAAWDLQLLCQVPLPAGWDLTAHLPPPDISQQWEWKPTGLDN